MQAGVLRNQIQIQRKVTAGGSLGHDSTTWEDVFPGKLWANIRYTSGSEAIRSGQEASLASVSIRIRWREGITAGMRVVHNGANFDIQAVLPDAVGRKHVDLVCKVPT